MSCRMAGLVVIVIAGAAVTGCAKSSTVGPSQAPGQRAEEPGGARPASQAPFAPEAEQKTTTAPRDDFRYAEPPPPDSVGGAAAGSEQHDAISRWLDELAVSEAAAMASGASCDQACRALRSMQNATLRLCEMAESDGEQDRCRSARHRLNAAKGVVRSSCGYCEGGPSLDEAG